MAAPVAAEADAAARTSDAEIVVTAQRRQQRLLDVPISVSAFSAAMIEKAHITEAKDYLALAPNISFTEDGEKGNRSINIAIRGVSNVDLGEQSTQQSIGYYIDELSTGSSANGTLNPQLLDIERIEVLRGPQGTYFGRNASGGAINITTKKPTDSSMPRAGSNMAASTPGRSTASSTRRSPPTSSSAASPPMRRATVSSGISIPAARPTAATRIFTCAAPCASSRPRI
ncbi:TonB-dependent receptor plug domain-containing protein [Rhizorhabdus histidinilytica]